MYVHSEAKAGRDAGELCGLATVGIKAHRTTISGLHNGQAAYLLQRQLVLHDRIHADWDLRPTGWRVEVDGDTPLDIAIRFPVPAERWGKVTSSACQ